VRFGRIEREADYGLLDRLALLPRAPFRHRRKLRDLLRVGGLLGDPGRRRRGGNACAQSAAATPRRGTLCDGREPGRRQAPREKGAVSQLKPKPALPRRPERLKTRTSRAGASPRPDRNEGA
jgi:hypothetical protein